MTPEFIRKYHIYKILNSPSNYGIMSLDGFVKVCDIAYALREVYINNDNRTLYKGCLKVSSKNIKRDIVSIEEFFCIEILFSKGKGYCIIERDVNTEIQQLIFDKMELYMASHKEKEWRPYVSPEKSSLNSSINIIGILHAIEQKKWINITYNGWFDDSKYQKIENQIQPLHLKESYKAWYLIGHDAVNGVKVYCLDERVERISISKKNIEIPYEFDVANYFKYSIGILNKKDMIAEKVVLSVANHHFKYLESKPLPNQKILKYPKIMDSEILDYLNPNIWGTIEATLQLNHELLMEIYKYNIWVKVMEPRWFSEKIANQYSFLLKNYYN